MNITFMIGNGFDVGLGMRSKFKDFFPIYKENAVDKKEQIKQLSNKIEGDYETWADFESALGKYTESFSSDNKDLFVEQIKDFEQDFIDYLKTQEERLSFDDVEGISKLITNALVNYYSLDNLSPFSNSVIKDLYSSRARENHVFNFINFNYTSVLKDCLATIKNGDVHKRSSPNGSHTDKIGKVVHVHGLKDSFPIIGVNDVEQISNKELANDVDFIKNIVKPIMNERIRMNYDKDASELISKSTIICVYGMSLGKTDKKWWDMLINWLAYDRNRHLIIFDYDKNYTSSTPYDLIEKQDELVGKLANYSNKKVSDIFILRDRIHLAIHKNIFEIDLRKNKSIKLNFQELLMANE